MKYFASPKIDDTCFATTARVFCSKCDADVATGKNKDGALCLSFCDEWLYTCRDAFFDPYQDPKDGVPFCREDSLVCSPVIDVVKSSRGLCEFFGFNVLSPS